MKNSIGLTDKEVIENRKKHGSNAITSSKTQTFWHLLLESLGDPIIKILLIALGIKVIFLMHDFDWFETVGIVIAIFLASFISSISEYGSEKAFTKLQEESSKIKCRVKRNNKVVEINIDEIVVNDIVLLESGDKIPADGIIIGGEISVDESSINGETIEKYKYPSKGNTIIESNKVFRGTVVYSKEATMLVTKVGDNTFYGNLASLIQEKQPDSPLKIRLRGLAEIISKIGYIGALLVSLSYLFSIIVLDNNFDINLIKETLSNGTYMFKHLLYALTLSVTIIVVAVPEGLPMMITLVLSSNMKKMLKNNVLVRKLVGIETAGSLNILYTDKTGTLTKGKLEVTGFIDGTLASYKKETDVAKYPMLHQLVKESLIYNNASTYDENKKIFIGGNITDRALISFIKSNPYKVYQVLKTTPFDSKLKYSSATVNKDKETVFIKGALEVILPKCMNYYDREGNIKPIYSKQKINKYAENFTQKGIRIIGLATSKDDKLNNLALVGFLLIKDEIRKEAIEGVKLVSEAGIQTVMITGDNKETAISIGQEVGIVTCDKDVILTSKELNEMNDEEVKKVIPYLKIVARSLPQDKSRLIRLSQELDLVVGMTGDGVNDAPALKKADVGFAMGSGTEVSKEASDIVILDDNFLSISKSIMFGRTIFKSIRKFIIFQLTINMCAIMLSIIGPFIGIDTPVTVIQMLWINMVMDTLAGLAFAFEPPLIEYMKEKPKRKDEPIINKYMKDEILFTGLYSALLCILFLKVPFIYDLFRIDSSNKYLMTAFFGLFIFMGIFNCFNARTHRLNLLSHLLKNKVFIFTILFIIIVQMIMLYFGGDLFRSFGLTSKEFLIMILLSSTVVPIDWMRKIYLRTKGLKGGV